MNGYQAANGTATPWYDVNFDGTVNLTDTAAVNSHNTETAQLANYSGLGNPYLFTGRLTDTLHADSWYAATDPTILRLQDNRNRTYSPEHGRWLQPDPKQYIDSMNLYEYVSSAPVVFVDPDGLQTAPGPQSITLLDQTLVGRRVQIHFEQGMHAHVFNRQNTFRETYYIWRNGRFVCDDGPPQNSIIKKWLGNQKARGKIQTAIRRGRMLQGGAIATEAIVAIAGWQLIFAEVAYGIDKSYELRHLSQDNYDYAMYELNREVAREQGSRAGNRLAKKLLESLTFSCQCGGISVRTIDPPTRCIEPFINGITNQFSRNSMLAYDLATGSGTIVPQSVEEAINRRIVRLYECIEKECYK